MKEYRIFKEMLSGTISAQEAAAQLRECIEQSKCPSQVTPLLRTAVCLEENMYIDFLSNLRQSLMYFPGSVEVTPEIKKIILQNGKPFHFQYASEESLQVDIDYRILSKEKDLTSKYEFIPRNERTPSCGDGPLLKYYGYSNYLSLQQKILLYIIKNLAPNDTLLACLPTGGGKSLSWELPRLSGQINGIVIVIVPTIALVLDHGKASEAKQKEIDEDAVIMPAVYHSQLNEIQRGKVLSSIENGTVSILYISPEALLSNPFQEAVKAATKNGRVSMLVVDEAHLIVQWGIRFRPEFQLIASLRNTLENISPCGIKTLLLSATLNEEDTEIIRKVFSSDQFMEYRADELRPEPSYYVHECTSPKERLYIIDKLVVEAPKPMIVYGTVPEQAKNYYDHVKELGLERMAVFTGETSGEDRDKLIDQWRNNEIDVMFATSAFGMGIDKADVRTVITAYIPENISRYYQEIGRAGRDGYASLNYWLPYEKDDWPVVNSLTKTSTLTCEKLVERWNALSTNSVKVTPDTEWLDLNDAAEHLRHTITGEKHRGWNKDVILFMLRLGLIDVLEIDKVSKSDYKILVHLLDTDLLDDSKKLSAYSEPFRQKERRRIANGIENVNRMLQNYNNMCMAQFINEEFPLSSTQCAGCPACRRDGIGPYFEKGKIQYKSYRENLRVMNYRSGNDLAVYLNHGKHTIAIAIDNPFEEDNLVASVRELINTGINIIFLPEYCDTKKILKRLQKNNNYNYLLLKYEEADKLDKKLLNGCCAVFLTDPSNNSRIYSFTKSYLRNPDNAVVYFAPADYVVKAERKPLSEIADASIPLRRFISDY